MRALRAERSAGSFAAKPMRYEVHGMAHPDTMDTTQDAAERNPRTRPRPAKWVVAWFAVLMLVTIVVRVVDPTGWLGSDDASYYSAAEYILTGEPIQRVHHHYARMTVVASVAASMWLFGENVTAVILPTAIASILCVALVAILGRLVWGWWEGLCAATIVSVLPFFRILSTAAFPDVHACLWATLAVLLALALRRVERGSWRTILGVACGVALGLAASAKIFSITAGLGVFLIICQAAIDGARRHRASALLAVAVGGLAALLLEGMFYAWAADDFWFHFHALRQVQTETQHFPQAGVHQAAALGQLLWDRMTMALHPSLSGWGKIGMLFLPAAAIVLVVNRRGRPLAAWALFTYLVVAFMPVSFNNGPQPFPNFHGRHILTTCIPFALCLAWLIHRAAGLVLQPVWIRSTWPAFFAGIVVLCLATDTANSGFRDRPTQRICRAIERMIASDAFGDDGEIFMTPGMYWRYRILFPPDLQFRLRVSTAEDAPDWWRHACVDIASRFSPLPPPHRAYLLTTLSQLAGQPEFWDYGVGLPISGLAAWQDVTPVISISRLEDKTVAPTPAGSPRGRPLLVLLTAGTPETPSVEIAAANRDR